MRKRYGMLWMAAVMFLCGLFPGRAAAEEAVPQELLELYARSAVLMDADSGRVLFGKEEDIVRPMASTTKIMTCILALENGNQKDAVAISANAAKQPKVRLGVAEQETFSLGDLLYSLMLESHNDSAVAIAEHIGGSVEGFADQMNAKAKEIGCQNTYFITPNGLDAKDENGVHSTTAADLARIMKYCIRESPKKDEFIAITQTRSYSFSNQEQSRSFSCSNHNAFLDMMDGVISGKTGFTGEAGYCYVGALEQGGRTFIVALLACGWPNNKTYKWADTKKLMNYGIGHYEYRDVWESVDLPEVTVAHGIPDGGLSGKSTVELQLPKEELSVLLKEGEQVEVETKIQKVLPAPVKEGMVAGEVIYMLNGAVLGKYEIVTKGEKQERTLYWCASKLKDVYLVGHSSETE